MTTVNDNPEKNFSFRDFLYIFAAGRKITEKNMLNINFTQDSETIKLFNTKGDILYSFTCHGNTIRKTLENARRGYRTILNRLLIVGADLSGQI